MYPLSPGNRVYWLDPENNQQRKATVDRIFTKKARIILTDFTSRSVDLDELELAPVNGQLPLLETLDDGVREQAESVREQVDCTLTDCTLTTDQLHPNSWIEEKMIRRGGKLHGPYLYERWRDATGKMKSKYLGKKK
jgi:hypothetical protein